jgi:hypothetical protein
MAQMTTDHLAADGAGETQIVWPQMGHQMTTDHLAADGADETTDGFGRRWRR